MTPYFLKRKSHLLKKSKRLIILEKDKYATHRTIVDLKHQNPQIRWEVDIRDFYRMVMKFSNHLI